MVERGEAKKKPEVAPKIVLDRLSVLFKKSTEKKPLRTSKGQAPAVTVERVQGFGDRVPSWTERSYLASLGKGKDKVTVRAYDDPNDPYAINHLSARRANGGHWDYYSGQPAPEWVGKAFVELGVK